MIIYIILTGLLVYFAVIVWSDAWWGSIIIILSIPFVLWLQSLVEDSIDKKKQERLQNQEGGTIRRRDEAVTYNDERARLEEAKKRISCPNCQSKNVEPVTRGEKTKGVLMWGVAGLPKMGKSWRCRDCKYTW
ncbi:MAG: hypothetical protein L6427_11320 [Actinomycetia bacterium]|nr:hypothetical protein [Actinomycetes bacterium]